MNHYLISQVQAGTHCIWNNDKSPEGNKKVKDLIHSMSNDVIFVWGESDYYWLVDGFWNTSFGNVPPTGLTPIPLDDFFKEEEIPKSFEGRLLRYPEPNRNHYESYDEYVEALREWRSKIHTKEVKSPPVPAYLLQRPANGLRSDSVIERSLQASKPATPEQPVQYAEGEDDIAFDFHKANSTPEQPTLPEELVRIHQKVIILQTGNEPKAAKLCTETTLDYIGRCLEWAALSNYDLVSLGWYKKNSFPEHYITTSELIQLFFDNQKVREADRNDPEYKAWKAEDDKHEQGTMKQDYESEGRQAMQDDDE